MAAIAPTMIMSFCVEKRFAEPWAWLLTDRFVVAPPLLFTVTPIWEALTDRVYAPEAAFDWSVADTV